MLVQKIAGRAGATQKYDLLTVLGSYALSQDRTLQRQTLRLICLITARYNWQSDQLSVAQTEIARLWSVDPRTVKREMAAFRARGWLVEKRAAGRGRVTLYGLGLRQIWEDTRPVWARIGPDLVARLSGDAAGQGGDGPAPEAGATVIPFPQMGAAPAVPLWPEVARRLFDENAGTFNAWFAPLVPALEEGVLILRAPGGFHASYVRTHLQGRIEAALRRVEPTVALRIEG
ncbi:hypothetical protein BVG79_p1000216 (plasmid) [Ketogulonicigenium robustum]|uniref:DnaA N-terminal domain-containing protein n=1 Tax=Ketogulonicigenium robustum TaxID=92947 RepID=A0A1W6P3D9_9RHOB|nr:DnaA N-terminal domain-containing protein [Ketogulonicigenium robustum]ARO16018.1 hypothetical protein BVG79_p1000216 [Ketogulonicigenium robustum]